MIICPNLHLPDVAREFNEIKAATSEKAAYHIWSANNGNGIDKAPNGAQSNLFNDLLRLTNGNRKETDHQNSTAFLSLSLGIHYICIAINRHRLLSDEDVQPTNRTQT